MALDGIFLSCICDEIQKTAANAKVDKIYQPAKDELVINLRTKNGNKKLFLSSKSDGGRICFIDRKTDNPEKPPMLCMLFRKKLIGAKLIKITQACLDRLVKLEFDAFNNIGELKKLYLVVELMGKQNNVILLDENEKIIDALRRVGFESANSRIIMPGVKYQQPAFQNKKILTSSSVSEILQTIEENLKIKENLSDAILLSLQGISPVICREIEFFVKENNHNLATEIENLKNIAQNKTAKPYMVITKDQKPLDIAFLDIKQYGNFARCQEQDSFSKAADDFYVLKTTANDMSTYSREIIHKVNSIKSRLLKKISRQTQELENSQKRDKYKVMADVLSANIYLLKKGMECITLDNFYDNTKINITLDPKSNPSQNIQLLYKKYKKAVTAEKILKNEVDKAYKEVEYLESVLDSLSRIKCRDDLLEIVEELYEQKYINRVKSKQKKKAGFNPKMYKLDSGSVILVGRNNKENDILTLKYAKKDDVWLHIKDMPGSHTIISRSDNSPVSDDDLYKAACVAAYYSKAKNSGKAAVDYTCIRNVKKPKGAKPGMVIYVNYNTLYVKPEDLSQQI